MQTHLSRMAALSLVAGKAALSKVWREWWVQMDAVSCPDLFFDEPELLRGKKKLNKK